jgi:hypothetical protein
MQQDLRRYRCGHFCDYLIKFRYRLNTQLLKFGRVISLVVLKSFCMFHYVPYAITIARIINSASLIGLGPGENNNIVKIAKNKPYLFKYFIN